MEISMSRHTFRKISRLFFTVTLVMAAFLAFQSRAEAAICKVQLEDVGTIIGKGSSKLLAFEDAAEKCFDKKAAKARRAAASLDEETGLTIIDECANLRCSSEG
mgnify:CR=1 FL=1